MQDVFVEKPYQFVPPFHSSFGPRLFANMGLFRGPIRRQHGILEGECRNLDLLRSSIDAGHGIMVTPNHPRTSDPMALGFVAQQAPTLFYTMASWHLFNQGWFQKFMLRFLGAFSVNREGLDRSAVDQAVECLVDAKRPLVIFPEGTTSRTNDVLMALMEGPSFIAKQAAKRREKKDGGKVVVHPIAIRYLFSGNLEKACNYVLCDIETKLTWRPNKNVPLLDRILKVGNGLLTLKELQYNQVPDPEAPFRRRQCDMVDKLLFPLEEKWLGDRKSGGVAIRVKNLRMKIFPDLTTSELSDEQRQERWQMLEDTYLAQQIDCYPEKYLVEFQSVDRILETVDKFEEDLTHACRVHGSMKVILDVDKAIEVSTKRERSPDGDPLMNQIKERLEAKLASLRSECRMYAPK